MEQLPERKRNRLDGYDYNSCGVYFLTLCTAGRRNLFWSNVGATIGRPQDVVLSEVGENVRTAINHISVTYPSVFVEAYVIMPNHVHLLLSIDTAMDGRPLVAPTMSRLVKQLKGVVSKSVGDSIWQKSFYDHVIRNQQDFEEHLLYIEENPLKWTIDKLYIEE